MPEPINTLKCPFRTDATGGFCDCYGKACMAYAEYDSVSYSNFAESTCNLSSASVKVSYCKRMTQPAASYPVLPPTITYRGCDY